MREKTRSMTFLPAGPSGIYPFAGSDGEKASQRAWFILHEPFFRVAAMPPRFRMLCCISCRFCRETLEADMRLTLSISKGLLGENRHVEARASTRPLP